MRYVLSPENADVQHSSLGGKARALAALRQADFCIPEWIVLLPDAFTASLSPEQRQALERAPDAAAIRALVEQVEPAAEVRQELAEAVARLCPHGEMLAVRSSASDEDGALHSFAGQLDSFLFVTPAEVSAKAAAVWRSAFSERIVAYRREQGLDPLPRAPAVLVQRMVCPDAAGVAFGADPISGRWSAAVVSAVYGAGSALVSGECDADTYLVDRQGKILERSIANKETAHRPAPGSGEGVRAEPVAAHLAKEPALTDEQVRAVAELARRAGTHFGRPQDVEWAIEGGKLYLLQSRPITSLAERADPQGMLNVWDNSNIAESYNGITTPLTFSFARRAYEGVYLQFCRLLRVPEPALERSSEVFRHLLGLVRGRIYYNLLNWYRVLALLPGFTFNRRFMEQMMGVKEGLPEQLVAEMGRPSLRARLRDGLTFAGSASALVRHHFTIRRQIRAFYRRLDEALGTRRPDLSGLRADELASAYRDLERQLVPRWDAPLINDFLAMIFHGVLRALTRKWCGDSDDTLANSLICGQGGVISAEPARLMQEMAGMARPHPDLVEALETGTLLQIRAALERVPELQARYREYLERFGDRCLSELKLESSTLHDDPLPLLRNLAQLARRQPAAASPAPGNAEATIRRQAEERAGAALAGKPFRRLLFNRVLRHARARVRDRENLRFERTRLFGRIRALFVELGRRLAAVNVLDDARDVFYLEVEEVLGFVNGTSTCTNLRQLAAVRKAEFKRYEQMEAPADRFETHGLVQQGNAFRDTRPPGRTSEQGEDSRRGLGCCPGVVRGPVRVVSDPRQAALRQGEILVAERTDPGWILLFAGAAGLLVERGSLLSHAAIVAREMGIPAVVSVEGVTRWLADGDWVELDGSSGVVVRCPAS